jgi:predicted GTPase
MKIRLLLSTLILVISCNVLAQKNQNRAARIEEMKAKRVAYVFQEAGLTAGEAEKVLPIYNEYKQKSWELYRQSATILKTSPASETEFEKAIENYLGFQQKEAALANEYSKKFRTVISAEKLFKLYVAEREFQRKAIAPQNRHK